MGCVVMKQKVFLLFLCIVLAIAALFLCVKQSKWEAELNAQLVSSYSRVLSNLESMNQSKQLTVSDVQMLKTSVDQFWGQLELFVDSSASKQINFDVAAVYHGFIRLSAVLHEDINSIQEDPSVLAALKEKLDVMYAEIKDMDDIESAAKYIREYIQDNWN